MSDSIDRWRRILNEVAGEDVWPADDPEVPAKFFQAFRPDARRLDDVFRGVTRGDEILTRLRRVYDAAGVGRTGADSYDWYFIVRNPAATSLEAVQELAVRHAEAVSSIARTGRLQIEVSEGVPPDRDPGKFDDLEAEICDACGDYVIGLQPEESDALLLREPLYQLACDYNLARYVLWPLYRGVSGREDPFLPYFELWARGAKIRYEDPALCRVWLPRLAEGWR